MADSPGFNYHEGVSGHVLDQDALVQAIVDAITNKDYQAVIKPELVTQEPTHSMDWLKENTQFIAKWQTSFGGSRSARDPAVWVISRKPVLCSMVTRWTWARNSTSTPSSAPAPNPAAGP